MLSHSIASLDSPHADDTVARAAHHLPPLVPTVGDHASGGRGFGDIDVSAGLERARISGQARDTAARDGRLLCEFAHWCLSFRIRSSASTRRRVFSASCFNLYVSDTKIKSDMISDTDATKKQGSLSSFMLLTMHDIPRDTMRIILRPAMPCGIPQGIPSGNA